MASRYRMILTRRDDVGPQVLARRDIIHARNVNDLYDDAEISEALRSWADKSAESLDRKAKKAGFKPIDSTLEYGIYGGRTGPVEFWLQRRFEE